MGKQKKGRQKYHSLNEPSSSKKKSQVRSKKNKHQHHPSDDDRALKASLTGSKTIFHIAKDGNCLFGSLSDQLYRDGGDDHETIRHQICDYLLKYEQEFSCFLVLDKSDDEDHNACDFESYVQEMRDDATWGGNLELVAAARLYRRNITVYSSTMAAFTIESPKKATGPDLLLSFHDNDHYNSVRDNMVKHLPPTIISEDIGAGDAESSANGGKLSDAQYGEATLSEPWDQTKPTKRPPTRNGKCPCCSGKSYKKCCKRTNKRPPPHPSSPSEQETPEEEMDGNFRVLRI